MKTADIKNIKIARKYANALIESASDAKIQDKIHNDLLFVSETIKINQGLKNALLNPIVSLPDKKEIASEIFSPRIEKMTIDFIFLLIDNNRFNIFDEIVNQYLSRYNEINNIINPTVISAVELEENEKLRITEKLENKLTKKVIPVYKINPEIIGGLIFEIKDKTIDFSIKTKFDNMKKQLTEGNRYGSN